MREKIEGLQLDEERALYNLTAANVVDCVFAGPADGESVLKEARDVNLKNCDFSLRYPLWHVEGFKLLEGFGHVLIAFVRLEKIKSVKGNVSAYSGKKASQTFGLFGGNRVPGGKPGVVYTFLAVLV